MTRLHHTLSLALCFTICSGFVFAKKELEKGKKLDPLSGKDPMKLISDLMRKVEQELASNKTNDDAQLPEERALEILHNLIKAAEQQQEQNKQQSQQQKQQNQKKQKNQQQKNQQQKKQQSQKKQDQNKQKKKKQDDKQNPSTKKKAAKGQSEGGQGKLGAQGGEWGSMPPQIRRELIDTMHENLPEKYKELLKLYYKELSESQK